MIFFFVASDRFQQTIIMINLEYFCKIRIFSLGSTIPECTTGFLKHWQNVRKFHRYDLIVGFTNKNNNVWWLYVMITQSLTKTSHFTCPWQISLTSEFQPLFITSYTTESPADDRAQSQRDRGGNYWLITTTIDVTVYHVGRCFSLLY